MLKIDVNSKALRQALQDGGQHFVEKEMRGVVSEVVNTVRDGARKNAQAAGLSQSGPTKDARGRVYNRRGKIPGAIYSYVAKQEGETTRGFVKVQRSRETFHWVFLEFGTVHMAPRPFFFRSLPENEGAAMAAAQKRFDDAIPRILKG
jgi:HK97 gp10 family phage protein